MQTIKGLQQVFPLVLSQTVHPQKCAETEPVQGEKPAQAAQQTVGNALLFAGMEIVILKLEKLM